MGGHGRWLCVAFTDANPKKRNSKNGKTSHVLAASRPCIFELGFFATEDPNNPNIEGTVYEFREGGFYTDECCKRDRTYLFPHARIAYDVEIGGVLVDRVPDGPGTTCHSWLKDAIPILGREDFFVEGDLVLAHLEMDRRKVEQRLRAGAGW
ncbi:hypothetical protein B0I37DRAFT_424296 [Chaetomium sp. MPI-CAGE-AT-0009]|nr:hypothetical protein B0I37DRAFT_424296 [Chaetomium sp. MPI-CAGE-AT-0009]